MLIVEDDEAINDCIAQSLMEQGMEIATASDGTEALGMLSKAPFDVVVLDLIMPRIGGLRVIEEARKHNWKPSVILISGFIGSLDEKKFLALGADYVLKKPLDFRILADLVLKLTHKAQSADV